jgi:hypothetical protein
MDTWEALQQTPVPELRRRAELIEKIDEFLHPSPAENGLFVWADGSGQTTAWQFSDDGYVLLLAYEHEGFLNVINDELDVQRGFYRGVPDDLMSLILRDPAATGFVYSADDDGTDVITASGVFWFDGVQWHVSEGLSAYCQENNVPIEESGLEYCTRTYLLGQEFNATSFYEHQVGLMDWMKEPERAELRRRIDAGFAAHGE